ncbi:MAG: hypothetical protein F7C33_02855, partial [Desulfurococcales archaeon]|nr:hypothetical protein [Desulfurococcales archaeon]
MPGEEWKLAALQVLHVGGWAAYFTLTRMVYSGDPGFLLVLAGVETLPTIAGLVGGAIAERYGYRPALLAGILEGLGLVLAGVFLRDRSLLLASVFLASLAWSIAGPQVYAYAYTVSGGSSSRLGIVMSGATIGYTLGSFAPALSRAVNPVFLLVLSGVGVLASYAGVLLVVGDSRASRRGDRERRVGLVVLVLVMSALAFTGVEIVGSVYMGKLSREVGPALYSASNAAAGLLGAGVRPLAGRIIDYAGPSLVLSGVLICYVLYLMALHALHGVLVALVWVIPIYPFLDLSLYSLASRLLGEAMGASVVSASYSVTGVILLAAGLEGLEGPPLIA